MPGAISHVVRNGACLVIVTCGLAFVAHGQANPQAPISQPEPKHTVVDAAANRPFDANQVMRMREQQAKKKSFDAANLERKRQLADDTALLLKLAEELEAEVGSSSTDTLSQSQLRKIEDIERLARNVQQKMKLTVGAS
jgi:hypothetical protein